jgi:hypothetical protein
MCEVINVSKELRQITKAEDELLSKIHDSVFKRINEKHIEVFLCGGASTPAWNSMRDQVRNGLKPVKNIRILYPEELFMEILNKDKSSNLLTLEEFLADNCDVICIICESPGSLVELGAFTNNSKTMNKVVVAINEKYRKKNSFIMTGPVKLIKIVNGKNNVLFYNDSKPEDLTSQLSKFFRSSHAKKQISTFGKSQYTLETLMGMYYFIPLVLYFYHDINLVVLDSYLKNLYERLGYNKKNYEWNYKSSIKLLYRDKYIKKIVKKDSVSYALTRNGYDSIKRLLDDAKVFNKDLLYNGIRFNIMKNRYY